MAGGSRLTTGPNAVEAHGGRSARLVGKVVEHWDGLQIIPDTSAKPSGSMTLTVTNCLVVTATHKARRLVQNPIELSDERSQRNRDSFAVTRAQATFGMQLTGRAD